MSIEAVNITFSKTGNNTHSNNTLNLIFSLNLQKKIILANRHVKTIIQKRRERRILSNDDEDN